MENTNKYLTKAKTLLPDIIDMKEIDERRSEILAQRLAAMLEDSCSQAEDKIRTFENDKKNAKNSAIDHGMVGFMGFAAVGLALAPFTGGLSLGLMALSVGTAIYGYIKRKSEIDTKIEKGVERTTRAIANKLKEEYLQRKEKALEITPEERQINAELIRSANIGKATGKHKNIEINNLVIDGEEEYMRKSEKGEAHVDILGLFVNGTRRFGNPTLDGAVQLNSRMTNINGEACIQYVLKVSTADARTLNFDKVKQQLHDRGLVMAERTAENPHSNNLPGQHNKFTQVYLNANAEQLNVVRSILEAEYGLAQIGIGAQLRRHMYKVGAVKEEVTPVSQKEEKAIKAPVATPYSTMRGNNKTVAVC